MKQYESKRSFSRTPEPKGGKAKRRAGKPLFVIQQHDASNEHFDFRIEVDGVLKSWAIPKGPSTDPRVKRLAVETEDHPIAYADFEGVIPAGNYGAGTVMIWDRGHWENMTEKTGRLRSPAAALRDGHLLMCLFGKKIRGGYALQRIESGNRKAQWLLIKTADGDADARRNPVSTERRSVASGRTMAQIAREESADE